jgi:hypothetical protein
MKQSDLGPLPYLFARVKKKMQICVCVLVCENDWPAFIAAASLEEFPSFQKILLKNSTETFTVLVLPASLFLHKYRSQNYGRKIFCLFSRV